MKQKIKILLVEDEALIALLLKRNLELLGWEVGNPVATGETAIQRVKDELPDVVLMDIRLVGKMNGIEAAREIRVFSHIPIIFMTGYSDSELKVQAEALHAAAYLIKPVTPEQIEPVLVDLFDCNEPTSNPRT